MRIKPMSNSTREAFVRMAASDDGQVVMAYLRQRTLDRALGADASDAQLRALEGQRVLVSMMERLARPA